MNCLALAISSRNIRAGLLPLTPRWLSGVVYVGDVKIDESCETAGTNGRDVWYAPSFIEPMSRKQLRFLVLHESLHKALHHCSTYADLCKKYPRLCNVAMDYVVNGTIEETDPKHEFVEHPTSVPPLLDPKFFGWSFVEVLQHLLRENGIFFHTLLIVFSLFACEVNLVILQHALELSNSHEVSDTTRLR